LGEIRKKKRKDEKEGKAVSPTFDKKLSLFPPEK